MYVYIIFISIYIYKTYSQSLDEPNWETYINLFDSCV